MVKGPLASSPAESREHHGGHGGAWPLRGFEAVETPPPPEAPQVRVDWRQRPDDALVLCLRPQAVVLGLGCHRGIDFDEMRNFVRSGLAEAAVSPLAVALLASVETRRTEPALLALSREMGRPLVTFSKEELEAFVPQFVEEGRLDGDGLYLLPVAKSTEVLYLNRTLFDRFATATGIEETSLATFEGLCEAAVTYYEWTDAQTPDVPNDGKLFYYPDGLFNYAMIGFQQMGGDMVKDERLALASPIFERIWNAYYTPAVKGGVAIYNDYGNYLAATGDIVCCTSTSAGATFYPNRITYADNTKEDE